MQETRSIHDSANLPKIEFITYIFYHIPINDTAFKLSVFWPSDTESRINELRFSYSVPLFFKTRLTSVTCNLSRG